MFLDHICTIKYFKFVNIIKPILHNYEKMVIVMSTVEKILTNMLMPIYKFKIYHVKIIFTSYIVSLAIICQVVAMESNLEWMHIEDHFADHQWHRH